MRAGAAARGPPLVVHVRDDLPLNRVGRAVRSALIHSADGVIAVSTTPRGASTRGSSADRDARLQQHRPRALRSRARRPSAAAQELGVSPQALLAQVAQITPWKGQDTAIRTVAGLRERVDAHLLVVGGVSFGARTVRYDNHEFLRSLHGLVEQLDVDGAVHFLGPRDDVPGILRTVDLSLLPSVNEPFGRAIVESMAIGTPPLVSDVGSGPELVDDGVSGRLLPPDRPELWVDAAQELLADRAALARMGERGRERGGLRRRGAGP